jgi:hypothetical protein
VLCLAVLIPWSAGDAQQESRPDMLTPRVMIVATYSDSAPFLATKVQTAAQSRASEVVSGRRLWVVQKRDIDNTLVHEWSPSKPGDFGEVAKLVRAVGAVVVTARGREDSLDVTAMIEMTPKAPLDSIRFFARSPTAAVDSIVRRLLADPRFARGPH